jgi:hypothetical protein
MRLFKLLPLLYLLVLSVILTGATYFVTNPDNCPPELGCFNRNIQTDRGFPGMYYAPSFDYVTAIIDVILWFIASLAIRFIFTRIVRNHKHSKKTLTRNGHT